MTAVTHDEDAALLQLWLASAKRGERLALSVGQVERIGASLSRSQAALQFYANEWDRDVPTVALFRDLGAKARAALSPDGDGK